MFNSDTELFFPIRVIPALRGTRGDEWAKFIDSLCADDVNELDQIAFTGMVVKMAGCAGCDADSFRAMRGCTQCAKLVLKRYKGTDRDLIGLFELSKTEVEEYLKKRKDTSIR